MRSTMNIEERKAFYFELRAQGDLTGTVLHFAAYLAPSWARENRQQAADHGWGDYQNAAALRELTTGDPQPCTLCERPVTDLVPWSGERLCWSCADRQLDLLATACQQILTARTEAA